MTPKREGTDIYSRVGNLEARVDGHENDISSLRGYDDHLDGRLKVIEEDRQFRRGAKWMLRAILTLSGAGFLEHWGLISKVIHWFTGQ